MIPKTNKTHNPYADKLRLGLLVSINWNYRVNTLRWSFLNIHNTILCDLTLNHGSEPQIIIILTFAFRFPKEYDTPALVLYREYYEILKASISYPQAIIF